MFKNVIFDWSGVVNDNAYAIYQTVLEVLSLKASPQQISFEDFRKQWKLPYMDFYHKFLPNFSIEEQTIFYKRILPKFEKDKLYPGMDKLIKELLGQKIKCFIISSDYPETLFRQIDVFGLKKSFFKEIIDSSHNKTVDVQNLIKKYNFNLNKTIFIGDSNHEIESAKENQIKSCGVTWGLSDEDNLFIFKPDFMAHNLLELEKILLK
jgi:phosphoglycolate phosphatase-like HAD superfamily hydrolase